MAISLNKLGVNLNRVERQLINENWDKIAAEIDKTQNEITDITVEAGEAAFEQVVDAARLIWQEPVSTFADLPTAYPNAPTGAAAMTQDTGKIYRFNGTEWQLIGQIDAGPVNELDTRLSTQLADKLTSNVGAVKSADLSQEVKEQLTGGSVAVVGVNSVLTENIVDKQVTAGKTNFVEVASDNLYNKDAITPASNISNFGNIVSLSTGVVSEFIPITPNADYTMHRTTRYALYDESRAFIAVADTPNMTTTITTPANARYIRLAITNSQVALAQMNKGTALLPYDEYALKIKYQDSALTDLLGAMTTENESWVV